MNLSSRLIAPLCEYSLRPLENWEQGRAKPNAQAALLINLVNPDTVSAARLHLIR